MESAIPILLFLAALFIFVMFALAMGMMSREQERKEAEESRAKARLDHLVGPRFFAKLEPSPDAGGPPHDRLAVVAALEQYVNAERLGARRFVAEPSAASLFRDGDRGTGVVVGRIERYLQEECRVARAFGHESEAPWIHVDDVVGSDR